MNEKIMYEMVPVQRLVAHPLNADLYKSTKHSEKDLAVLRSSIEQHGVQEPLLVTRNYTIISGHRRRFVAEALGIQEVPVRYIDNDDPLAIEALVIESNRHRRKSNEDIAREYMAWKRIEEQQAKARQMEAPKRKKRQGVKVEGTDVQENPPERQGQARDLAAEHFGMSGKTLDKAVVVVQAIDRARAEGDEEAADEYRRRLNKSMDGAYRYTTGEPEQPRMRKTDPTRADVDEAASSSGKKAKARESEPEQGRTERPEGVPAGGAEAPGAATADNAAAGNEQPLTPLVVPSDLDKEDKAAKKDAIALAREFGLESREYIVLEQFLAAWKVHMAPWWDRFSDKTKDAMQTWLRRGQRTPPPD